MGGPAPALKTVDYVPGRNPIDGWGGIGGNGGNDSYGNRCDRFLACIAYLDGERPSVVMCRGVYGRIVMAAWDWRRGRLSQRWVFDSGISYPPYAGCLTLLRHGRALAFGRRRGCRRKGRDRLSSHDRG
jgi:rhamnogalacturonan endolyase